MAIGLLPAACRLAGCVPPPHGTEKTECACDHLDDGSHLFQALCLCSCTVPALRCRCAAHAKVVRDVWLVGCAVMPLALPTQVAPRSPCSTMAATAPTSGPVHTCGAASSPPPSASPLTCCPSSSACFHTHTPPPPSRGCMCRGSRGGWVYGCCDFLHARGVPWRL